MGTTPKKVVKQSSLTTQSRSNFRHARKTGAVSFIGDPCPHGHRERFTETRFCVSCGIDPRRGARRQRVLPDEDKEVVVALFNDGMPLGRIAEKFDASVSVVRNSLALWTEAALIIEQYVLEEDDKKARITHNCTACGGLINKGERYRLRKMVGSGRIALVKWHLDCVPKGGY